MDLRSLRSRPREKRGRICRHDTDSLSRFHPHSERMERSICRRDYINGTFSGAPSGANNLKQTMQMANCTKCGALMHPGVRFVPATLRRPLVSAPASLSMWRVSEPDHPVFTPACLVEFGTTWIQLPPWRSQHDPALRDALADESLFDPIGAPV